MSPTIQHVAPRVPAVQEMRRRERMRIAIQTRLIDGTTKDRFETQSDRPQIGSLPSSPGPYGRSVRCVPGAWSLRTTIVSLTRGPRPEPDGP